MRKLLLTAVLCFAVPANGVGNWELDQGPVKKTPSFQWYQQQQCSGDCPDFHGIWGVMEDIDPEDGRKVYSTGTYDSSGEKHGRILIACKKDATRVFIGVNTKDFAIRGHPEYTTRPSVHDQHATYGNLYSLQMNYTIPGVAGPGSPIGRRTVEYLGDIQGNSLVSASWRIRDGLPELMAQGSVLQLSLVESLTRKVADPSSYGGYRIEDIWRQPSHTTEISLAGFTGAWGWLRHHCPGIPDISPPATP